MHAGFCAETANPISALMKQNSSIPIMNRGNNMISYKRSACGVLVLLLFAYAFSQQTVSGTIDSQTFTGSDSIYIVEKQLTIPEGVVCSLDAAKVILFKPFTGITVEGTLIANGTSKQPIVFTSIYDTCYNPDSRQPPESFDWNGIAISAQSGGNHFRHSHLSYSVHGIQSQTEDLKISDCLFSHNGLYHFTIKNRLFEIREGAPFSYPEFTSVKSDTGGGDLTSAGDSLSLIVSSPSDSLSTGSSIPDLTSKKNAVTPIWKKPSFRFGALGAGILGCIGGAVLHSMALEDEHDIQKMKPTEINPETGKYYTRKDDAVKNAHDSYERNRTTSIASLVIGGMGLSVFAITFTF